MYKIVFIILFISSFVHYTFNQSTELLPHIDAEELQSYLDKAESYKAEGDLRNAADYYNKIAYIYWENEQSFDALKFFNKSLVINLDYGNINAVKAIYNNIGLINLDIEKYEEALYAFKKFYKISAASKHQEDEYSALMNMATVQSAIGNHADAIDNLHKALRIAEERNDIKLMRPCYVSLYENYDKIGDSRNASSFLNKYVVLEEYISRKNLKNLEEQVKRSEEMKQEMKSTLRTIDDELRITRLEAEAFKREKQIELDLLRKEKFINSLLIKQHEDRIRRLIMIVIISIVAGSIIFILLIIIFIQNRNLKTQKRKLYESENKFRLLFEESEDPFLIIDNSEFVDCNDALINFLGFTCKDDFLHELPLSIAPDLQSDNYSSEELFEKITGEAYEKGYARNEWIVKKANGRTVYVDASYTSIEINNKIYLYAIWRDINRQKKAEIELTKYRDQLEELVKKRTFELQVSKEKAEESDKLKTVFIGKVIQKINTPLNAIINISKMLMKVKTMKEFQKNLDRLELIHESGNELKKLNDSIVRFSKLESGLVNLQYSLINIKKFVYKIESQVINLIEEKEIKYSYTIAEDFPSTIYSDQSILSLIVESIIENAVKFTQKGYIRFSAEMKENWYYFIVEDSGIGMEKSLSKDINDNSMSFTDSKKGGGFGLILCKRSIELLKGEIYIDSQLNKGTKVIIKIPRMRYK